MNINEKKSKQLSELYEISKRKTKIQKEENERIKCSIDEYFYYGIKGFFRKLFNKKPDYFFYKNTIPLSKREITELNYELCLYNKLDDYSEYIGYGRHELGISCIEKLKRDKEIKRYDKFRMKYCILVNSYIIDINGISK